MLVSSKFDSSRTLTSTVVLWAPLLLCCYLSPLNPLWAGHGYHDQTHPSQPALVVFAWAGLQEKVEEEGWEYAATLVLPLSAFGCFSWPSYYWFPTPYWHAFPIAPACLGWLVSCAPPACTCPHSEPALVLSLHVFSLAETFCTCLHLKSTPVSYLIWQICPSFWQWGSAVSSALVCLSFFLYCGRNRGKMYDWLYLTALSRKETLLSIPSQIICRCCLYLSEHVLEISFLFIHTHTCFLVWLAEERCDQKK